MDHHSTFKADTCIHGILNLISAGESCHGKCSQFISFISNFAELFMALWTRWIIIYIIMRGGGVNGSDNEKRYVSDREKESVEKKKLDIRESFLRKLLQLCQTKLLLGYLSYKKYTLFLVDQIIHSFQVQAQVLAFNFSVAMLNYSIKLLWRLVIDSLRPGGYFW